MELRHSFVIQAGLDETWAHFQDIATVAECFPGATVTSAEGDDFQGTAKVKLGPVALQYSGAGSFIERDEAARRMVFEAKGKDKRGNGTAGATVTLTFSDDPGGTRADVATDLSVTGKPAQFGSRMLQEVSDKLLGQFVDCLQQQVASGDGDDGAGAEAAPDATQASAEGTTGEPEWAEGAAARQAALAAGDPLPTSTSPPEPSPGAAQGAQQTTSRPKSSPSRAAGAGPGGASDDALDLGTTVLPVLARMYGKQLGAGLVVLVLLWLLRRRTR